MVGKKEKSNKKEGQADVVIAFGSEYWVEVVVTSCPPEAAAYLLSNSKGCRVASKLASLLGLPAVPNPSTEYCKQQLIAAYAQASFLLPKGPILV